MTFERKLESFKYDPDSGLWLIRLEPKSGVFITHTKALDTLGWQNALLPSTEIPKEQFQ